MYELEACVFCPEKVMRGNAIYLSDGTWAHKACIDNLCSICEEPIKPGQKTVDRNAGAPFSLPRDVVHENCSSNASEAAAERAYEDFHGAPSMSHAEASITAFADHEAAHGRRVIW